MGSPSPVAKTRANISPAALETAYGESGAEGIASCLGKVGVSP